MRSDKWNAKVARVAVAVAAITGLGGCSFVAGPAKSDPPHPQPGQPEAGTQLTYVNYDGSYFDKLQFRQPEDGKTTTGTFTQVGFSDYGAPGRPVQPYRQNPVTFTVRNDNGRLIFTGLRRTKNDQVVGRFTGNAIAFDRSFHSGGNTTGWKPTTDAAFEKQIQEYSRTHTVDSCEDDPGSPQQCG